MIAEALEGTRAALLELKRAAQLISGAAIDKNLTR